jgi:hypothetical protein
VPNKVCFSNFCNEKLKILKLMIVRKFLFITFSNNVLTMLRRSILKWPLKVVTNEKGEALVEVLTIIC